MKGKIIKITNNVCLVYDDNKEDNVLDVVPVVTDGGIAAYGDAIININGVTHYVMISHALSVDGSDAIIIGSIDPATYNLLQDYEIDPHGTPMSIVPKDHETNWDARWEIIQAFLDINK